MTSVFVLGLALLFAAAAPIAVKSEAAASGGFSMDEQHFLIDALASAVQARTGQAMAAAAAAPQYNSQAEAGGRRFGIRMKKWNKRHGLRLAPKFAAGYSPS